MTTRLWLRLAEILTPVIITIALMAAWNADRRDRAELAAQLAAAKQSLAQADARQRDRDAQLLQTLAAISAQRHTVTTPEQIVRDLPKQLPLPSPITLQQANNPSAGNRAESVAALGSAEVQAAATPKTLPDAPPNRSNSKPAPSNAVIPGEDLKPLYDFALDCKACQAKLAASQSDLADEREKTAVLTKERDQALRIAKGGSALRRFARAAKWLAIGAALGAAASRAAH